MPRFFATIGARGARAARLIGAILLGLSIASYTCCRWKQERPNVLLITVDSLRADRLGCYGYKANRTPNIDRLAGEGVLFERAYCDVPWTTPSMASVFTGLYATKHGFRSTYQRLADDNLTLAEALKGRGYSTAAFIGSYPLDAIFGLDQGFDLYDQAFDSPVIAGDPNAPERVPSEFHENADEQRWFQFMKARADAYRPDDKVSDAVIRWLRGKPKEPFFLWVHYFGPHEKIDIRLSEEEQKRKILAEYDRDVETNDREVGRVLSTLAELGLMDRTITVLHADHGQSLGEHSYVGHGKNLYDPTLRIPLIIRYPARLPKGRRLNVLARNVDIFPTVLELAGLPVPPGLDGRSLVAALTGWRRFLPAAASNERTQEIYCETYLSATEAFGKQVRFPDGSLRRLGFVRRGIRTSEWKYVVNEPSPFIDYSNPPPVPEPLLKQHRTEELYRLSSDPAEQHNVSAWEPATVQKMRNRLAAYMAEVRKPGARQELDEASKERLRALGYME